MPGQDRAGAADVAYLSTALQQRPSCYNDAAVSLGIPDWNALPTWGFEQPSTSSPDHPDHRSVDVHSTSRTAISSVMPAALMPKHPPLELEAQAIAHSDPCHLKDSLASNPFHKKDSKEANLRTHHKD